MLLEQQQELIQVRSSGERAAATVVLDQTSVGRLSRMDAMQSQVMLQEAARRRELLLRDIDDSLRKIESGDYGICEECGENISKKRMLFNPSIAYCIKCSSEFERENNTEIKGR